MTTSVHQDSVDEVSRRQVYEWLMEASEPRWTTSMAKTALDQKSPSDCFGYEPISMVTCSFSVGLQMLTNHSHSGGNTSK